MAVSVEALNGLERKINVSLPSDKIESEVSSRLNDMASRAKMDGFRPGKAPLHLVKQRYSDDVRLDVIREMLQPSLFDALKAQDLNPVASPQIDPGPIEPNQDFDYSAIFEVFPEFEIKNLEGEALELIRAEVEDTDVDATIEKLREQHKLWHDVTRPAENGDKLIVDFDAFEGDVDLGESGRARDFEVILGAGAVLPALEAALVGAEAEKSVEHTVEFEADWHDVAFAGKTIRFNVDVKQVLEGTLPPLDDALAETLNIKEGGVDALKKDVRGHMERALERRVNELNREAIFNVFLKQNPFDLPKALVDEEIKHLQHEFYHQVFGAEHSDDEKIPDFPRQLFEEKANRRVHLGLLFADYVKQENIAAEKDQVDAMIEKSAKAYDDADEVRAWYRDDAKRMAELEALVIEEKAAAMLSEQAQITDVVKTYEDVINPPEAQGAQEDQEQQDDQGESA